MIQFRCPECQKLLQVAPENAGKLVACPCGGQSRVPSGQENPAQSPPPGSPQDFGGFAGASGAAPTNQPDPAFANVPGAATLTGQPGAFDSQGGYGAGQPMDQAYEPPKKSSPLNSTTFAGIAMMVGAAVWFFVGLAAGRIFFYPPILFIFGIVSFFKGLMGGGQ